MAGLTKNRGLLSIGLLGPIHLHSLVIPITMLMSLTLLIPQSYMSTLPISSSHSRIPLLLSPHTHPNGPTDANMPLMACQMIICYLPPADPGEMLLLAWPTALLKIFLNFPVIYLWSSTEKIYCTVITFFYILVSISILPPPILFWWCNFSLQFVDSVCGGMRANCPPGEINVGKFGPEWQKLRFLE
jgi:hypothetical protein